MAEVLITEFTDPGCPFAFSAEPFRRKLEWLYGDRIEWRPRMVVLAEAPDEYLAKGFEPPKPARSSKRLAGDYGMPMDTRERPRMAAPAQASRRTSSAATTPPTCRDAALGGD